MINSNSSYFKKQNNRMYSNFKWKYNGKRKILYY